MWKLITLLSLMLLDTPTTDDFVPKDAPHAVAMACMISGINDPGLEPYAEAQVFLKWQVDSKGWDFKPVMARRLQHDGGSLKAIDDCIEWYQKVKATIEKAQASKQP